MPGEGRGGWLRASGEGLAWLLASALVVVAASWPMAAQVQGHLLEPLHLPDVQGGMFWPWAFARSLAEGVSPYQRPELLWPAGQDIRLIVWNHGVQWLIFPFFLLWEPITATNLAALWLATLNGAAGAWAARAAGGGRAAGLAGLALAASAPYGLVETGVGRPEQGFWAPVALFLGGLVRLWQHPSDRRAAVLCGLGMALAGATYWFYAIFLVVLLAALLPVAALLRALDGARLRALVLAGGVSVLAVLPFALPLVLAWAGSPGVVEGAIAANAPVEEMQARASVLVPGGFLGPWAEGRERAWRAPLLALPACILALALVRGGGVRLAAGMGLLAAVLAAGPTLSTGTGGVDWALPMRLVNLLPGFSRFWWPYRWQAVLLAAAAVSAGALVGRARRPWLVAGLLAAWSVGEAAVMLRDGGQRPVLGPARVSPLFAVLAELPGDAPRPILQLPTAWLRNSRVGWIAWHHQPIDGGMGWGLRPDQVEAHQQALSRLPLMQAIEQAAAGGSEGRGVSEGWTAEQAGGFHYLILYSEGPTEERSRLRRGILRVLGAPFYEDPSLSAWVVPGVGERPPRIERRVGE